MRKLLALIILLGWVGVAWSATITYNSTDGNWNDATKWIGGSIPALTDDAVFDASSGNCTITTGYVANITNINFSLYTKTLQINSTSYLVSFGNVTLGSSMVYNSISNTGALGMKGNGTLITNGKAIGAFIINATGSIVSLGDNLTSSNTITLTAGTLDTNNKTVTANVFSSSNSNTRTLNLTNSTIILTGASTSAWTTLTSTGLTLNAGTSRINLTGSSSNFAGGSKTYYEVILSGAGASNLNGVNSFTNLARIGTAVKTDSFTISNSQNISNNFNLSGNNVTNRILIAGNTLGTQIFINVTGATLNISNCDFRDINIYNTSVPIDLSAITGGSGDCGGNANITFTPAQTLYWYQDTGSWSDVTKWRNSTNGTVTIPPLPQDTARFNASSFTTTGKTVTQDMPRIGSVDWTGATNSPTFNIDSIATEVYGNYSLISGMTLGYGTGKNTNFLGRGAYYFDAAGKYFGGGTIVFNSINGTYTQLADFSNFYEVLFSTGTFDANDYNISTGRFGGSTSTVNLGNGTMRLKSYGNNAFRISSTVTFNSECSTIIITPGETCALFNAAQNRTFNNVIFNTSTSVMTINGGNHTFNNFTIEYGTKINITAGLTQSAKTFLYNGTSGSPIICNSTTIGSPAYLNDIDGGTNYFHYTNITDITAQGGATFDATDNCVNVSNAIGWTFTGGTTPEEVYQFFIL